MSETNKTETTSAEQRNDSDIEAQQLTKEDIVFLIKLHQYNMAHEKEYVEFFNNYKKLNLKLK